MQSKCIPLIINKLHFKYTRNAYLNETNNLKRKNYTSCSSCQNNYILYLFLFYLSKYPFFEFFSLYI